MWVEEISNDLSENGMGRTRIDKGHNKHFPFSSLDASSTIDAAVARQIRIGKKVHWNHLKTSNNRREVVHLAHSFNGVVKINAAAETSLPGLFASGEVSLLASMGLIVLADE